MAQKKARTRLTRAQRERRQFLYHRRKARKSAEPFLGKGWWKKPSPFEIDLDLERFAPVHMSGFSTGSGRPRNTDKTSILFYHVPGKGKPAIPFGALRTSRKSWKELRALVDGFFAPRGRKSRAMTNKAEQK
jgi:hypothetical protein